MSYDNIAEEKTVEGAVLETANTDSIEAVEIPHSEAIFSHLSSLAHVHALSSIKCTGSDKARAIELEETLASLTKSFSLTEEQVAYLRHIFKEQVSRKESFIAERFTELEKRVTELAKSKIKNCESDAATPELSKLREDLEIEDRSIQDKIEKRAARLAENAFLISVKDLARKRLQNGCDDLTLTIEDLSLLSEKFEDLELTPRVLERANQLYENTISVN